MTGKQKEYISTASIIGLTFSGTAANLFGWHYHPRLPPPFQWQLPKRRARISVGLMAWDATHMVRAK